MEDLPQAELWAEIVRLRDENQKLRANTIDSQKIAEAALHGANEELHRLINSVPGFFGSAELTEGGEFQFRYFSQGCLQVFGRPPEYFLEQTPTGWLSLIHPGDLPSLDAALQRVLSRASTGEEHDYRVRWPDDSYRWVRDSVRVVRSEDGRYLLYGAISDVTSQHRAEEVIKNSLDELERRVEERTSELELSRAAHEQQSQVLESVLQCMADGVLVANDQGHFIHFNPAAEKIIGFGAVVDDASSWARHYGLFRPNHSELFAAEDLPLARARRGETVHDAEIFVCNDNLPEGVTISVNASPLYSRTGELQGGVAVLRDITDQKRYQERLLAEEALLRKLLELQEQDRKLVSYELHDGLLQYVIGAKLIVEALYHASTGKQRETAEAVRHLLGNAIEEGRAMISGLRPMIIDEQGIIGAIQYLISDQPNQHIDIRFTHGVQFDRLDPRFEQTVYRIVQEALTNVRRHSGAEAATVDITQQQGHLHIEVRDSGSGFVPAHVPSDRFGIRGIQERARLFGGSAKIISAPGEGATVSVTIPLPQPDHP